MKVEEAIPLIHATPTKAVLYITGGGTEVLPMLLKRGGGSATLLDAQIPYANEVTVELLGGVPDKFVSEETTRKMAMAAYQRALKLRGNETYPVVGVACSSSLQKTPSEREGRIHHIFAALQTGYKTVSLTRTLDPGHFTWEWHAQPIKPTAIDIREWEERINAEMVLYLLAEGCGIEVEPIHNKIVRHSSHIHDRTSCEFFPAFLAGEIKALMYTPGRGFELPVNAADSPKFLLPGSFNPAHAGHEEMAKYVEDKNVGRCDFELSIHNADKPLLDFIALEERLLTVGNRRVWITNAPTFVQKSELFPKTMFLVGSDTAKRIVDPKYAGPVAEIVAKFKKNDTRFVVFGREINGVYHAGLEGLPQDFLDLCINVPDKMHHDGISSTQLRNSRK